MIARGREMLGPCHWNGSHLLREAPLARLWIPGKARRVASTGSLPINSGALPDTTSTCRPGARRLPIAADQRRGAPRHPSPGTLSFSGQPERLMVPRRSGPSHIVQWQTLLAQVGSGVLLGRLLWTERGDVPDRLVSRETSWRAIRSDVSFPSTSGVQPLGPPWGSRRVWLGPTRVRDVLAMGRVPVAPSGLRAGAVPRS
jgi:hypothetical protein